MKELKLIPFNRQLIGADNIVVKLRNGAEVEVFALKNQFGSKRDYNIISISKKNGATLLHRENGCYGTVEEGECEYDLLMYKEIPVIELYVVKCRGNNFNDFFGIAYLEHEQATKHVGDRDIEIIKFREVTDEL